VIALIDTALALQGTPYRNGGADPTGFDCSGFIQYVFARSGLALPRAVHDQFDRSVETGAAPEPGDLIFFTTVAPGPSHVGIVIDADRFIHAPSSRGVVRIEHISARYWSDRFVGIRRVAGVTLP
jgi:cell wall-associated NlpC family hydrolase